MEINGKIFQGEHLPGIVGDNVILLSMLAEAQDQA